VLAERVREPFYRWYGKVARAMRNFVQGDIMGSDRRLEEALQGGAPISPELLRHIYCIQKNAAMRMRGQVRETESIVREMMLQFPKITGWSAAWGALCWDLGQHDEARRSLERLMVRGAARARTESSGLATCVALSELCCKVGDATAARDIYTVMAPYADHHAFTDLGASTYGPVSRHLASLAECQGDAQLAETHYRAALAAVTRMGSPVFTSGTSSLYARMLLRSGDARRRVQAAELLSSAHQIASKSQLHALVTVCRGFAERYGIRLDRPGSEQDHVRIPDA
jgi:hypothetical protein